MSEYRKLDAEDIEKLRYLLRSAAWQEVVRPVLLARKAILMQTLLLDREERADKSDDQKVKGRIQEIDWIVTRFEQAVDEFDHNSAVDERQRQLASVSP